MTTTNHSTLITSVQSGWDDSGAECPPSPTFLPKELDLKAILQLPWSEWLQQWFDFAKTDLPDSWQGYTHFEVALRLTSAEEVQSLNSLYRGLNEPTDVLAFANLDHVLPFMPAEMFSENNCPVDLGDIVISLPTALEQARSQNHDFKLELIWLAAHGFLHLLGWDHPDPESLTRMLKRQVLLLHQSKVLLPFQFLDSLNLDESLT